MWCICSCDVLNQSVFNFIETETDLVLPSSNHCQIRFSSRLRKPRLKKQRLIVLVLSNVFFVLLENHFVRET